MSDFTPITVYVHTGGPNPYKVLIVLEELGIPYNKIVVADPKKDEIVALNPNGRVPIITDPNNKDFTIWESGAIVEYLVERYDKQGKLTVEDPNKKWQLKQFLHFQMSGQGPYFGQAVWFHRWASDNTVGKERYLEQTVRVFEVLDNILKDKEYLVGDKCTYADLCFVPWNKVALFAPFFRDVLQNEYKVQERYPNFLAWFERLISRPAVKRAYGET
ncbi:glutathione S-transferase [Dactylonectria estremocensis]|uniref:Glutathione S-transferase n=1 Tax=Dactylonectria estremocensis TaxID=1079267 RepID=A0A9P9ETQ0_9HYPO|nr:glutathione S-transferase [Dactylonectria estremocensis]